MIARPVIAREQRLQTDVRGVIRCAYERGVPTVNPHLPVQVRHATRAMREISRLRAEYFSRQLRDLSCWRTGAP
jgi:hypothetical protein